MSSLSKRAAPRGPRARPSPYGFPGRSPRLFSQFRAHYRFESRYRDPYSGNERGSVENAMGFLRRNLLVPVPAFGTLPELNAFLAEGVREG